MANTYTQVNIHAVFSVKGRENFIQKNFRNELHQYISGILKNEKQYPLAVNGWKDHIHLFFELNPITCISDLLRVVKSKSSKWINDNKFIPDRFSWQEGYGAFSYSKSQRNNVIQYIINQEQHHKLKSFRKEYIDLLDKFEIEFNERYMFMFYDRFDEFK